MPIAMSKREPLLSDAALRRIAESKRGHETSLQMAGAACSHTREIYEAARAKDAELIQMAVDACTDPHKMSLAAKFLEAAKAEGFTPTPEQ